MRTFSTMMNFVPIILSGGSGTRLWPVSRGSMPKQFCHLFDESLFEMTLERMRNWQAPYVVTNKSLQALTEKKLRSMKITATCLYEPKAANTAAAIYWACLELKKRGLGDYIAGVFPADHVISDNSSFQSQVTKAVQILSLPAHSHQIFTLGIRPDHASTEYGYIEFEPVGSESSRVLRFHEKPHESLAKEFFKSGHFLWNSGMFIFRVDSMLSKFSLLAPEIESSFRNWNQKPQGLTEVYNRLPSISFDKAILEKIHPSEILCLPSEMGWSDVGTWDALSRFPQAGVSSEKIVLEEAKNLFFSGPEDKIYAAAGVEDLIVVDTSDALVITRRGKSHLIKKVVEKLQTLQNPVVNQPKLEERPWGFFEVIKESDNFKSKLIQLEPEQQLSYQSHQHREEHWILVRGEGLFTLNDQLRKVQKGDYLHIPKGAKHRIKNTGSDVLEFIEVQLGSSFDESDITRYLDDYKRIENDGLSS